MREGGKEAQPTGRTKGGETSFRQRGQGGVGWWCGAGGGGGKPTQAHQNAVLMALQHRDYVSHPPSGENKSGQVPSTFHG